MEKNIVILILNPFDKLYLNFHFLDTRPPLFPEEDTKKINFVFNRYYIIISVVFF